MLDFENIIIDPQGVKISNFLSIGTPEQLTRSQVLVRVQNE